MTQNVVLPENFSLEQLDQWFDQRFEQRLAQHEATKTKRMAIISAQGTLDAAYPPFILASTAAALGWEVEIFFTFYGLSLLNKNLDLGISPLGNPAMPMKLPYGPKWLQQQNIKIPTVIATNIPGFEKMATGMMEKTLSDKGVASIETLRDICIESEVRLLACQMTVDLFGWGRDEFIDDIADWIGATSFLPQAASADVCLYM